MAMAAAALPAVGGWGSSRYLVGSSAGYSGHTMSQLFGTAELGKLSDQITYAASLAGAGNYGVAVVALKTGVNDYIAATPAETFKGEIESYLFGQVLPRLRTAIGDPNYTPLFEMPLTCAHQLEGFSSPYLALAQLDLADKHHNVVVSSPGYMCDFNSGGVHETAAGYRLRDAYTGVAAFMWHVLGRKFRSTRPIKWSLAGDVASIHFHVTQGPIGLFTDWISDPGNYGLVARDAFGTVISISSVTVNANANDQIDVTCAAPPATIEYAWANGSGPYCGRTQGPRGCIADSFPLTCQADGSTVVQLRNYSVPFLISFANGET